MEIKVQVWYLPKNCSTPQPAKAFNLSQDDIERLAFEKWLEGRSSPEDYSLHSVDIETIIP